MAVKGYELRV